ncbi:hypothetical protein M427DRAFT_38928 [Gonapodya prolifera JEL478]|uniref:Uncharacterized protein n=1 Tax=Gonapodya prolifera (strain JEL478) TaxID=1344416 RepID=A0A138ZYA0_GONPJ|nr:hypothetical protein M427DRAFT_38928 [Gonapodya prolifera JEL478]|eukprot:KXS09460.1 hypothetical protein M427DRAFT_38928 [Gonapodya prolifera JEL478]
MEQVAAYIAPTRTKKSSFATATRTTALSVRSVVTLQSSVHALERYHLNEKPADLLRITLFAHRFPVIPHTPSRRLRRASSTSSSPPPESSQHRVPPNIPGFFLDTTTVAGLGDFSVFGDMLGARGPEQGEAVGRLREACLIGDDESSAGCDDSAHSHQATLTFPPNKSPVKQLLDLDQYLVLHNAAPEHRFRIYNQWKQNIDSNGGGIANFTRGEENCGLNYDSEAAGIPRRGLQHLEPALAPIKFLPFGHWELFLTNAPNGTCAIPHGSKVKATFVNTQSGESVSRLPAWIRRAEQTGTNLYSDISSFPFSSADHIAIVGISSPELTIATYAYFTNQVLPHVRDLG